MKPEPGTPQLNDGQDGQTPDPWEILCGSKDVTAEVGSTLVRRGSLWLLLAVLVDMEDKEAPRQNLLQNVLITHLRLVLITFKWSNVG